MANLTHYDVLEISSTATQADIKLAYRRLAKKFHPDSNHTVASHDHIATINAAYEVLGDPKQRQTYDSYLSQYHPFSAFANAQAKQTSKNSGVTPAPARSRRTSGRDADDAMSRWLKFVYRPVCQSLSQVLNPFNQAIDALSADPFDDDLIDEFQMYIDQSRGHLATAQALFRTHPNPPSLAKAASNLYHCLSQVSDGLDELERFTTSYDDYYLHTGHELFRIARGLKREAQADVSHLI